MKRAQRKKHPGILEAVHETAKDLCDANIINATTMKKFDRLCSPKSKECLSKQTKCTR